MMKSLKLMSCNVIIALLWGCSTVPLAYFTDVQIMSDDGGANYYLISKLYRENGSNPQVLISASTNDLPIGREEMIILNVEDRGDRLDCVINFVVVDHAFELWAGTYVRWYRNETPLNSTLSGIRIKKMPEDEAGELGSGE